MHSFQNARITIAGLGHFGGNIAATRWLVEQGARVRVTDTASAEKLAHALRQLEDLSIDYRLGSHDEADFTDTDLVVASPAIPPSNTYLQIARHAGVPVTTEIRLFVERCPAPIIGVTGTKGKSTATALLGRMLGQRYITHIGGNIGASLLPKLSQIDKSHWVVLELSSYMLHYLGEMRWSPHVALVTMIASDHLEWHGSHEAYLDAKRNIVRFQGPSDIAVVNARSPASAAMECHTLGQVVRYGLESEAPFNLMVPGPHNQLNAQGAFAAARLLGVTWDDAQAALCDFAGLPHRLQLVHEADGIRYYNDSIATIPQAAVAALEAFAPGRVIQIVGGADKGLALHDMCDALRQRAKAVMCIGKMGTPIAEEIARGKPDGALAEYCVDLATAIARARRLATAGDVVLLSPGCASYDQFAHFEQRGEQFTRLARGED